MTWVKKWLRDIVVLLDFMSSGKWFVLSSIIGIVAGLGAITFQLTSQAVLHFTLVLFSGYSPHEPAGEHAFFDHQQHALSPWRIVLVMAGEGLVSGIIVYTFAPEAEGHGTDAAIESFHQKRGFIRARIPMIKMISSAITIGTGGSGGREGPIAQIGAGFGSGNGNEFPFQFPVAQNTASNGRDRLERRMRRIEELLAITGFLTLDHNNV